MHVLWSYLIGIVLYLLVSFLCHRKPNSEL
jgi:hypothetical protein